MLSPIKYTCAACRKSFSSEWSEEEAMLEFQRQFPGREPEAIVCDDCYSLIALYRAQCGTVV